MSLSERLRAARVAPGGTDAPASDVASSIPAAPPSTPTAVAPTGTTTKPATVTSTPSTKAAGSVPADDPTVDPLVALKERAASALFERIGARLNNPSLTEEQLHAMVRSELNKVVEDETVPLTSDQRVRLITDVQADVLGHGPLEKMLDDPEITEIMVNGPDMIFVERAGQLTRHPSRFASEEHLRQVIERIVSRIGRRVDESSPLVDARLADGSRVNAVIPPLAVNGSSLTIRKFSKDPFKVHDLIRFGTLTPEMSELLQACVEARLNIIVSGGTGSGKTTLLNVCPRTSRRASGSSPSRTP